MPMTEKLRRCFLAVGVLALAAVPLARAHGRDGTHQSNPEKGWFFYQHGPLLRIPPKFLTSAPQHLPTKPAAPKCSTMSTWTAKCGFVNPGTNFDFQAKERDALLKQMSMSPDDRSAVQAAQYYMRWVTDRAIEAANVWQYNLVQNPSLDPTVRMPFSELGLQLMTGVKSARAKSIYAVLKKEKAFLVYFSRYNCDFCQAMDRILLYMRQDHGISIWNTPIDGKCMPNFKNHCYPGRKALLAAEALRVRVVPTVFLYVPGGSPAQDLWMRISTGLTDEKTLSGRIVSFFTAYRRALLEGVHNGIDGTPPVDFSSRPASGVSAGIPAHAGGSHAVAVPTAAEVRQLLTH